MIRTLGLAGCFVWTLRLKSLLGNFDSWFWGSFGIEEARLIWRQVRLSHFLTLLLKILAENRRHRLQVEKFV